MNIDKKTLKFQLQLELAKREFFYFCYMLAPDFYKKSRAFLVTLSNEMQDFYQSDDEVLIVNVPP